MKLVKVITEIKFAGSLKLLKDYEELHLAILGQELKQPAGWFTPGLTLHAKQKKMKTAIEQKRCAIELEEVPNTGYCVQTIAGVIKKVNDIIGIPLLTRVGVRTMWLEPFEETFRNLLTVYKKSILATNILCEQASDVGLVLDFVEGDCNVNLTTGPMQAQQLKAQFLSFEQEAIPEVFIFSDIDYATISESKYSSKFLNDFIQQGLSCGEKWSKTIVDILIGK